LKRFSNVYFILRSASTKKWFHMFRVNLSKMYKWAYRRKKWSNGEWRCYVKEYGYTDSQTSHCYIKEIIVLEIENIYPLIWCHSFYGVQRRTNLFVIMISFDLSKQPLIIGLFYDLRPTTTLICSWQPPYLFIYIIISSFNAKVWICMYLLSVEIDLLYHWNIQFRKVWQ